MRKKFVKVMLFGALAFSTSVAFVGCKDYDDDISSLNERVSANETAIKDIQGILASGDWVKSVESIENGVKITLGSGKTFNITNGADGANGANGTNGQDGKPGTVWTIGEDGYWYQDGVKTNQLATPSVVIGTNGNWFINGIDTGVQAKGKDGANGTDGKDGQDGTNGTDGKDGQDGTNGTDGKDGQNGQTPYIGDNGNWWIGTTDTTIPAKGQNGQDGTDGKDGQNGQDGTDGKDGQTPFIGANGNWWIGTTDTKIPAKGQNGANGSDGKDGTDGTNGANGKTPYIGSNGNWWIDGQDLLVRAQADYYEPDASGFWKKNGVLQDGTNGTQKLQWKAEGTVTAVVDPITGKLTLSGVSGVVDADGKPTSLVLSLNTAALRALIFDPQAYVGGVPAIIINALSYKPMKVSDDAIISGSSLVTTTQPLFASYYMNPSSVAEEGVDTKQLSFISKTVDYYTRAAKNVVPTYSQGFGKNDPKGKLTVKIEGDFSSVSTGSKIDVVALKVPVKPLSTSGIVDNAENGVIISDFATLYKAADIQQNQLAIANPQTVGTLKEHYPTTLTAAKSHAIPCISIVHNSTIDLATYVMTHVMSSASSSCAASDTKLDLSKYGLEYKFEISGFEYKVSNAGEEATDQQEFISFVEGSNNTVVKARTYGSTGTIAAVGRTPLVRVTLIDTNNNNAIVKIAYIKIKFTEVSEVTEARTIVHKLYSPALKPTCATAYTPFVYGTEDMNVDVYTELGMTKEQFHARYALEKVGSVVKVENAKDVDNVNNYIKAGSIEELGSTSSTQNTYNLKWTINPTEVWNAIAAGNANKYLAARVTYKPTAAYAGLGDISFEFYAQMDIKAITGLNVTLDNLLTNYWDNETAPQYFKVNVKIPAGATDETLNTTFETSLWSGFNKTSVEKLLVNAGFSSANIAYYFEFASNQVSPINGISITATQTQLKVGSEIIAEIDQAENKIIYKNGANAKKLLATGVFDANIVLYGSACGHKVNLGGYAQFKARFITPVTMAPTTAAVFEDGKDGGSSLLAKNVAVLSDWRGRAFADNANYYGYYGVTALKLTTSGIKCNLGANGSIIDLSATQISVTTSGSGLDTKYIYNNNGTTVERSFKLYLPIEVVYYWGSIEGTVTVTVNPTL